ncbi:hypothetical protein A3Q56_03101 [Intoshia linei]|uniref:protein disulfide-isomerase n=1 Tax=Intoshia linei TaxID=1819745 RepID=A0A177B4F5_9BILA|nr:hypothetical protein A3Q56_03101 [Intoshia linei]
MKFVLLLQLFFIWGITVDGTELTDKTFKSFIEEHEKVMVMFYAPWCGHCNSMKPAYAEAKEELLKIDNPSYLALVDSTVYKELASEYNVEGYPTIVYFLNGENYKYEGGRTKEDLVEFMTDPKAQDKPVEVTHVKIATTENFYEIINSQPYVVVMFYAPWCGHCKKFLPIFDTSSNRLDHDNVDILLVKVDATVETELANKFAVNSYPTFKQFRQGRHSDFNGPRSSTDEFTDYVKKHAGIASEEITEYSHVPAKISIDTTTVIGLFEHDSSPLYNKYIDASSPIRDQFVFYHTFGEITKKLFSDYKLKKGAASILVIKPKRFTSQYEEDYFVYTDNEALPLTEFLDKHSIPLVGEFTQKTKTYMYKEVKPILFAFMTVDWTKTVQKETQYWRNQVLETAKKFKKLVTFVIIDDTKMSEEASNFGFGDTSYDFNVGILAEGEVKYRLEEELDEWSDETVSDFVEAFLDKKLKPYYKSQRSPLNQGIVKTAVGSTFNEMVVNSGKNVFLKIYAPWCGHCKKLSPKFEKLAKDMKKKEDLIFVQVDTTQNDIPSSLNTDGFPTLFLIKKGSKVEDAIKYDEKMEYEDMKKFINDKLSE